MKGDFTRDTHRPVRRYASVRMQQGRVQIDADWNEQADIQDDLRETALTDVIGRCGCPRNDGGFAIGLLPGGDDLTISAGRYYVDGILCRSGSGEAAAVESFADAQTVVVADLALDGRVLAAEQWVEVYTRETEAAGTPGTFARVAAVDADAREVALDADVSAHQTGDAPRLRRALTFLTQPDLPDAAPELPEDADPDEPEGVYLAYLDVWKRHVTALEDPAIREVALGGPDTATRLQTIHQVRLLRVAGRDETPTCAEPGEAWAAATARPTGRLRARTRPGDDGGPCVVPSGSGYTRLENQLYRVEVHRGGELGTATCKWSRDNGTVVSAWLEQDGDVLRVASAGRDDVLAFHNDRWVELTDDDRELRGEPGLLVRVQTVDGDTLDVDPGGQVVDLASFGRNPKVRAWDSDGELDVEQPAAEDGYLPLEGGIEVRFEAGTYRSGDYWLIPARAFVGELAGDIEWPRDDAGQPVARRPDGVDHHYCKLALVRRGGEGFDEVLVSCRTCFPPLTELPDGEGECCCCTVTVGEGADFERIEEAIAAIDANVQEVRICLLPGRHVLRETVVVGRDGVTISGCGPLTRVEAPPQGPAFVLAADGVAVRELAVRSQARQPVFEVTGVEVWLSDLEVVCLQGLAVHAAAAVGLTVERCRMTVGRAGAVRAGGVRVEIVDNRIGSPPGGDERPGRRGAVDLLAPLVAARVAGNRILGVVGHGVTVGSPPEGDGRSLFTRDVEIVDNEIAGCGGSGITRAAIVRDPEIGEPDPATDRFTAAAVAVFDRGELPTPIDELTVSGNTIVRCAGVARPAPERGDGVPLGGVVLAHLAHLVVRDNRIEDNGTGGTSAGRALPPIAGVYVADCLGLEIAGNRIVGNGPPADGSRIPGVQGGIVGLDLSVALEPLPPPSGDDVALEAPAQPDGWPAASVHHNLVVAPRGHALRLEGVGPMQVSDNRLVARDVLAGPDGAEEGPADSIAAVLVVDYGEASHFARQLAAWGLAPALRAEASLAPQESGPKVAGGKVGFQDNQVLLDSVRGPAETALAAVGLFTFDDVALGTNQVEVALGRGDFLAADVLALGLTVRAVGNGFWESFRQVFPYSFLGFGVLMCTAANNQGTHCIECRQLVRSDGFPSTSDHNNLQLLCARG